MPDAAERTAERSVLDQSYALLEYLSAVAREIGPKPVRDIRKNDAVVWPSEVPDHRAVVVGPREEGPAWLSVGRVQAPAPVAVPTELTGLIELRESLQTAVAMPCFLDKLAERRVETQLIENSARLTARLTTKSYSDAEICVRS